MQHSNAEYLQSQCHVRTIQHISQALIKNF